MGQPVKILDLAKELIKRLGRGEIEITGMRPGETLEEKLMLEEEKAKAVKKGEFWIIK